MRPSLRIGLAALAALVVAAPLGAAATRYPQLGIYGSMDEGGYPYLHADSSFNDTTLSEVTRFDHLIVDVTPITPYKPELAAELRRRNPDMKLIAYWMAGDIWDANRPDSANNRPAIFNHMIRDMDGYLYNKAGGYFSIGRVNLAKRSFGRYVVAEAVADFYVDMILASGSWDGAFLDVFCKTLGWANSPAESIDYVRAGYSNFAQFDTNWQVAVDTLANRLRRRVGPDVILIGNCGQAWNYGAFNGWMRENFPYQNGGTWYSNMFRDPGGYFVDDARMLQPPQNYLSTIPAGINTPYTSENARRVRYGLATASLGEGFSSFNTGDRSWRTQQYQAWWYDEYAVDLGTGMSSQSATNTGWLGEALGPRSQMIWVGTNPDAVTNPSFEADVTSGWTLFSTVGATRALDPTTAAAGLASARITIPTSATPSWSVSFATSNFLAVNAGSTYSATFWAKASTPRNIVVVMTTSPGSLASQNVAIDTTWRQYQIALVPYASGNGGLGFYLADAAGDVWLDDVHLQYGATTLHRRDFQNGIVLVNPSAWGLTVPLERQFRKILGSVVPSTNNGSLVNSVTVPAQDAVFLIGDDQIPPAAIRDLVPINPQPSALRSRPPNSP
jgi:hypothetical protein